MPEANSDPYSLYDISIVDIIIAGKTENIPLNIGPIFDNNRAIDIIIPASIPLKAIFLISYLILSFWIDFILNIFSSIIKAIDNDITYIAIDIKILFKLIKIRKDEKIIQIINELKNARYIDLLINIANIAKKHILIPNSAGIITADSEAKFLLLLIAKKIRAITIVEGSVPRIPPILVPYFSAMNIIIITNIADNTNGKNN